MNEFRTVTTVLLHLAIANIETQPNKDKKKTQTAMAAEAAVEKKVVWIRQDQQRRVLALEERQDKMLRHAQLAEAWADDVEKVREPAVRFAAAYCRLFEGVSSASSGVKRCSRVFL